MITLLAQVGNNFNPEAMIRAAVAANAAESAAWYASVMSGITLGVLLIMGVGIFVVLYTFLELKRCFIGMREKFEKLERNTDGILQQLLDATRKLAMIEGHTAGRAEQAKERAMFDEEQAGLKKEK